MYGAVQCMSMYLLRAHACCRAAGGIITAEDLMSIEPKVKEATTGEAFGVTIITCPPPSSGTLSIPALRILEAVSEKMLLDWGTALLQRSSLSR